MSQHQQNIKPQFRYTGTAVFETTTGRKLSRARGQAIELAPLLGSYVLCKRICGDLHMHDEDPADNEVFVGYGMKNTNMYTYMYIVIHVRVYVNMYVSIHSFMYATVKLIVTIWVGAVCEQYPPVAALYISLSLSLSLYIYTYIHTYMHVNDACVNIQYYSSPYTAFCPEFARLSEADVLWDSMQHLDVYTRC